MGGLLIADTLLEFINSRPNQDDPLWPRIIACLAFDTPASPFHLFSPAIRRLTWSTLQYLGIHPGVVKNTFTKAAEYATIGSALFGALAGLGAGKAASSSNQSSSSSSNGPVSMWSRLSSPLTLAVGGAVLAAAAGAYYGEELNTGFNWATDHLKYVGNLWDEAVLKKRFEALTKVEKYGVTFRT
jgi:hypothetical protein